MGSYTELYFNGHSLFSTKSYADPFVMTLFRESDKRVYTRMVSARDPVVWGPWTGDEDSEEMAFEYAVSIEVVKQRLDIMGFSLAKLNNHFSQSLQRKIASIEESKSFAEGHEVLGQVYDNQLAIIESTTLSDWIESFRRIIEARLTRLKISYPPRNLPEFILLDDEGVLAPYLGDFRFWLRLVAEACPNDSELILDLTEVTYAGYYELDEPVCERSRSALLENYPANAKVIILTEGSSDSFLLQRAMKLLYPSLFDYYSFMDFGSSNVDGGASSLVKTIKAFCGSGVSNRVIALFDNNTAAKVALRGLGRTAIPSNIKVMHYPTVVIANEYPTIGPGGVQNLNVNGLAGSLEMYFGRDILNRDEKMVPVQWGGFDSSLKQYQGELTNKNLLQEAFQAKLGDCEHNPSNIGRYDWVEIQSILTTIFNAFT